MGYGPFDLRWFRPRTRYPSRFEPDQVCTVNPWDDPDYRRRAYAQGLVPLVDPRDQAKAEKPSEILPVEFSTAEAERVDSDSLSAWSSNLGSPGTTVSPKLNFEFMDEYDSGSVEEWELHRLESEGDDDFWDVEL